MCLEPPQLSPTLHGRAVALQCFLWFLHCKHLGRNNLSKPPGLMTTSTATQKHSTRCYKHLNVLCSTHSDYSWCLPSAPQEKSAINHLLPYQLQAEIEKKLTEINRRVSGAQSSPLCLRHDIFNL